MNKIFRKFIDDRCIPAGKVIRELGISRNKFYDTVKLGVLSSELKGFMEAHENDWVFTPEKLSNAISVSGLNQNEVADRMNVHHVRLNVYIHGHQIPKLDYPAIRDFCKKYAS